MSPKKMEGVIEALKHSKKGQLIYDSHWKEEGRTQEIVNSIKENLSALHLPSKLQKLKLSEQNENHRPPPPPPPLNDNNSNGNDFSKDTLDRIISKFKVKDECEFKSEIDPSKIENYENKRQSLFLRRLEKKQREFYEDKESAIKNEENELRMIQKKYLLESIRRRKKYEEEFKQLEQELEDYKQIQLQQDTENKNNVSGTTMKKQKIEEKNQELLLKQKEQQQKQQQQIDYKNAIIKCKNEIDSIVQEFDTHLKDIQQEFAQFNLTEDLISLRNALIELSQDSEVLLVFQKEYSLNDVQVVEEKLRKSLEIKEKFLSKLLECSHSMKSNEHTATDSGVDAAAIDSITEEMESIKEPPPPLSSVNKPQNDPNNNADLGSDANMLEKQPITNGVSKSSADIYLEYQTKLIKFEELCKKFCENEQRKQMRTSIQIYIRSIVNTICNISVENLREKLLKLLNLFERKEFEHNGRRIKISLNDYSYHFAINTAVKIIINAAVIQKNITELAPITIILWANVSMFGDIFLSHLYLNCPYTIPYFPTQAKDQDDLEFKVICGYQLQKNKQIESDESYHSRMFSLVQLYSGIIQCNMPPQNHPHDIHHAWRWLALVLNDQPKETISALILDAFLSISVHKLLSVYGKQSIKLIVFIRKVFLLEMDTITSAQRRQSLMKFESLLTDIVQNVARLKRFPMNVLVRQLRPDGLVPDYFFQQQQQSNHMSRNQR